jgi:hypothetical protein
VGRDGWYSKERVSFHLVFKYPIGPNFFFSFSVCVDLQLDLHHAYPWPGLQSETPRAFSILLVMSGTSLRSSTPSVLGSWGDKSLTFSLSSLTSNGSSSDQQFYVPSHVCLVILLPQLCIPGTDFAQFYINRKSQSQATRWS